MDRSSAVRIGICTPDTALSQRLAGYLALWGREVCVELDVAFTADAMPAPETELLIFEAGGDGEKIAGWAAGQRRTGRTVALIALTEDSRRAIASYLCHPNAFLHRKAGYAGLAGAMDRCFSVWQKGIRWLELPSRREWVRIPLCQVQYAEAQGRNTLLHCAGGVIAVSCALGQVAEQLPQPPFFRCQRSFFVHLSAAVRLQGGELLMSDGQTISVGRSQLRELREHLQALLKVQDEEMR